MTAPIAPATAGSSTRPYLIRALHDWCTDNGFTPYIAVYVDDNVRVPREYVKNHEIVLNVGFEATSGLKLGNEAIEFKARFGGTSREISVPVDHVIAIYARENGQGMAFPMPPDAQATSGVAPTEAAPSDPGPAAETPAPRGPRLARTGGHAVPGARKGAPPATAPVAVPPPAAEPSKANVPGPSEPVDPPPEPPKKRPSLKRVK
jgi:stringent starvation protein B